MKLIAPEIFNTAALDVPSSKSIANRLLIIQALAKSGEIIGLSEAMDTQLLQKALKTLPEYIDVGPAGTSFRFLSAFLTTQKGNFTLTGSERMKQRPVGILVDALRFLGANISYLEKEGFPPLRISGTELAGKKISVDAHISSQFITALMLIGPYLPEGLDIELKGDSVSFPYLQMTANLMGNCGVAVEINANAIKISKGAYQFESYKVEKDWSAIAFWYEWVAINQTKHLLVKDVRPESIQGDRAVSRLFQNFGVKSSFSPEGLKLSYDASLNTQKEYVFDLKGTPDLAQPLIVILAAQGKKAVIHGLSTLKNKETNRGLALQSELRKFGVEIMVHEDTIQIEGRQIIQPPVVPIKTYDDHRMAMAFAPLVGVVKDLEIENPNVVKKSYPNYWLELEKLGMNL